MEPQNEGVEDDCPFKRAGFQVASWFRESISKIIPLNKDHIISAEVPKNLGDLSEIFAGRLALKTGKGVGQPRPSSSRDGPFQAWRHGVGGRKHLMLCFQSDVSSGQLWVNCNVTQPDYVRSSIIACESKIQICLRNVQDMMCLLQIFG